MARRPVADDGTIADDGMKDGTKADDGMKEVGVNSLGVDKNSGLPVVILEERDGGRILPIWIGPAEASAIALELANIEVPRPLTHDLLNAIVRGLGCALVRVNITKVVNNTYYASLIVNRGDEFISIDSRPSDGIAAALRAKAPIFAEESLLARSGVDAVSVADGADREDADSPAPEGGPELPGKKSLREYLEGLDPEDFGRFDPSSS